MASDNHHHGIRVTPEYHCIGLIDADTIARIMQAE